MEPGWTKWGRAVGQEIKGSQLHQGYVFDQTCDKICKRFLNLKKFRTEAQ